MKAKDISTQLEKILTPRLVKQKFTYGDAANGECLGCRKEAPLDHICWQEVSQELDIPKATQAIETYLKEQKLQLLKEVEECVPPKKKSGQYYTWDALWDDGEDIQSEFGYCRTYKQALAKTKGSTSHSITDVTPAFNECRTQIIKSIKELEKGLE